MDKNQENIKVGKTSRKSGKTSGFFSAVTMSWMNPLLKSGYERPLNSKDLYELSSEDQAEYIVNKLNKAWEGEVESAKECQRSPRLWRALLDIHSWQTYILILLLKSTRIMTNVGISIFLWYFLNMIRSDTSVTIYLKVLVAVGLASCFFVNIFTSCFHTYLSLKVGMRMKVGVIHSIYSEVSLCLSHS